MFKVNNMFREGEKTECINLNNKPTSIISSYYSTMVSMIDDVNYEKLVNYIDHISRSNNPDMDCITQVDFDHMMVDLILYLMNKKDKTLNKNLVTRELLSFWYSVHIPGAHLYPITRVLTYEYSDLVLRDILSLTKASISSFIMDVINNKYGVMFSLFDNDEHLMKVVRKMLLHPQHQNKQSWLEVMDDIKEFEQSNEDIRIPGILAQFIKSMLCKCEHSINFVDRPVFVKQELPSSSTQNVDDQHLSSSTYNTVFPYSVGEAVKLLMEDSIRKYNINENKVKKIERLFAISTNEEKCALLDIPYIDKYNDVEKFREHGPCNPILDCDGDILVEDDYECSGGCRMFVCNEFEHEDDSDVDITDETPNRNWFTGECSVCGSVIPSRKHCIRLPLINGGYKGCFDRIECVSSTIEEYDKLSLILLGRIKSQIENIGLYKD